MADKTQDKPLAGKVETLIRDFLTIQCRYQGAITVVQAKLEVLDSEFQMKYARNPIHHMQCRLKRPASIAEKLHRKGYEVTLENAVQYLTDIAGVRVVCSYLNDVYTVANFLMNQDNITVIKVRDYIKEPKSNGYRSLHIVVEAPVYLQEGKVMVPVEIQIRSIAMDFWATLEHTLQYKNVSTIPEEINHELLTVATEATGLDKHMQSIYDRVLALE